MIDTLIGFATGIMVTIIVLALLYGGDEPPDGFA